MNLYSHIKAKSAQREIFNMLMESEIYRTGDFSASEQLAEFILNPKPNTKFQFLLGDIKLEVVPTTGGPQFFMTLGNAILTGEPPLKGVELITEQEYRQQTDGYEIIQPRKVIDKNNCKTCGVEIPLGPDEPRVLTPEGPECFACALKDCSEKGF